MASGLPSIAEQQGFFHWELDFATVFSRGGFDLQLGNPPWVRPRTDVDALLAEGDPWWQLALKPSESARRPSGIQTLALPGIRDLVVGATTDVVVTAEYVGSAQAYPFLAGLQPISTDVLWSNMESLYLPTGIVTLIHPEPFHRREGRVLREQTYLRLRRHWQFINELRLYEIEDHVRYGVHIYGIAKQTH